MMDVVGEPASLYYFGWLMSMRGCHTMSTYPVKDLVEVGKGG
jgi:hypothetical protein